MSALVASPALAKVRELQRALYRSAKADPRRRFHALHDKVHRRDVLERAWAQVRASKGAAGIDQITIAQIEQHGVDRLLDELERDLQDGSYRPLPARRVFIPKPGSHERRPLSIRTTPCRSSSMSPGRAGGGWWRPISPRASRRSLTPG